MQFTLDCKTNTSSKYKVRCDAEIRHENTAVHKRCVTYNHILFLLIPLTRVCSRLIQ
jgi:hypothetical protein